MLNFVISSGIAYRVIENKYLIKIFKLIFPSFTLLNRLKLSHMIKEKLLKEKEKIIEKIKDVN